MAAILDIAVMQLTVGPVGPRGQNFRGSGKWRLCVRRYDRQTFLLLGAVKNQISVGPGYLLDPLAKDLWLSLIKSKVVNKSVQISVYAKFREPVPIPDFISYPIGNRCKL